MKANCLVFWLVLSISAVVFSQEADQVIVAKVNDMVITLEELNHSVMLYNTAIEENPHTPEEKAMLKIVIPEHKVMYLRENIVRDILLSQEALRRGLDKEEEVEKLLLNKSDTEKRVILASELIKQEISEVMITATEIETIYETNKDFFRAPEERYIREIIVPTEREAKKIYIKLLKGADFATLARKYSVAISATKGGDLGFVREGDFPLFDSIAFSENFRVGDLSRIFRTPEGYCIIKLEAQKGGEHLPFSEAEDTIKQVLTKAKQHEKIENLYSDIIRRAHIEIYEERIRQQ